MAFDGQGVPVRPTNQKAFGLEWTSWAVPSNISREPDGIPSLFSTAHASTPHLMLRYAAERFTVAAPLVVG
jgi:hypothetical protein